MNQRSSDTRNPYDQSTIDQRKNQRSSDTRSADDKPTYYQLTDDLICLDTDVLVDLHDVKLDKSVSIFHDD
jgi:hypothetical protein